MTKEFRYLQTAEVSKLLKKAIQAISVNANVSVRKGKVDYIKLTKEVKEIDVFVKNYNRLTVDEMNRIAKACRAHVGVDQLYGTPLRRFILSGEVAYRDGANLIVPWRKEQQNQLMTFEPEEVVLGCEKVNLYIGRGTTGPFTEQADFTWVMNNFELGLDGYAQRVVPA